MFSFSIFGIIFKPLGFGDYRVTTSLISGIMSKEGVVSSLYMLFGSKEAIYASMSLAAAFCLLVFCLLYTPCVAAIASIRRELGHKWAIIVVLFQCLIAWLCSLLVVGIGLLIGLSL